MRCGPALRATATRSDHAAAIRLAGAIWPLLGWRGCYEGQLSAARLGVRAARVSGDMVTEPRLHAGMGFVQMIARRGWQCGVEPTHRIDESGGSPEPHGAPASARQ